MFSLYGMMIGIAVVVGLTIAERIDSRVSRAFPYVVLGALLGARLYHLIDFREYYLGNLDQILAVWNGGLGIWGGVIGGGIALVLYQKLNKINDVWRMIEAVVVALPLAQAIGRVGNYLNGEFTNQVGFMPWWSVEAMLNLLLFGVLGSLHLRGLSLSTNSSRRSRVVVGSYLVGYGAIRFALEYWRIDSWTFAQLAVAQWVSLVSIVIGLWLWQLKNVAE